MQNKPFFGTFKEFFEEFDVPNKLIRYWYKRYLEESPDTECLYGYITQVIKISDNKIVVGIQAFDERYIDNKFPSVDYYDLNDLAIVYYEKDAEDES